MLTIKLIAITTILLMVVVIIVLGSRPTYEGRRLPTTVQGDFERHNTFEYLGVNARMEKRNDRFFNKFGKGMVVSFFPDAWTSARDLSDLTRDVDYALSSTGSGSLVDVIGANENIDIAVGKTTDGFTVAIVNHDSNKLEVLLKPTRSRRCSGGKWIDLDTENKIPNPARGDSLKLTVNGNAVRVIEFRGAAPN
ncbi:MAG TPA: hypothetical protein VJS64_16780 [Pyrinomonadaceae bacterium]|nr:hypothetical protein [Pyrinomonadaceae bacterium]